MDTENTLILLLIPDKQQLPKEPFGAMAHPRGPKKQMVSPLHLNSVS